MLSNEDTLFPTDIIDEVKNLKREKKFEEAIEILLDAVDSMEDNSESTGGVAPWYYEQLAIIYSKNKQIEKEIEILERYSKQRKAPGKKPEKLAERLKKVKQKREIK